MKGRTDGRERERRQNLASDMSVEIMLILCVSLVSSNKKGYVNE